MKKRYLMLVFIVLICCLSFVSASENVSTSNESLEVEDAIALSDGEDITADINEDLDNENTDDADENATPLQSEITIQLDNVTDYKASDNFEFKLINGTDAIPNAVATYDFGLGANYDADPTDENGVGYFPIGLSELGEYTVTVSYANQSVSKNIKLISDEPEDINFTENNLTDDNNSDTNTTGNNLTDDNSTKTNATGNNTVNNTTGDKSNQTKIAVAKKVVTKNVSSSYGTKAKYTVKVLDKYGKIISGKKVTIKIGKNTLNAFTNSKGIATFYLNYNAGKYSIKYYADKVSGSNTYTVKNAVTFTILKWGLKGDVSKSKLIKKSMPNNEWVKKAVAATKKGIPLLKFKGGNGKIVFITAGVHGNELSSQVAAMRMINYLSSHPIKGTVYIMPFVNVKAISKKVRYTDKDFNRIAAKSGTVSNNIVKLVSKYKCNAYGDFHTTKPGGAPGQNIVMGSKSPTKSSAALTKYISKNCKVNKRIYSYAGQQYPGALADNVNRHGIPAVICEVVLPHNTLTAKSIKISYNMMTYLLKFNSII